MKTTSIKILSILFVVVLGTTDTFSQTKNNRVANPAEYYYQRSEAIHLVKNENWSEAIPILENLIDQYQYDADLFYVLGLSYYQVKSYQKAITALEKTLDLGGTILSRIPTGSAPSNDIMIQIAKAYAKDGDKENAMLWLQKGFEARYDEKPFLKGSSAFENFINDIDFQKVLGIYIEKNSTREEAWKKDIDYLVSRIEQLHFDMDRSVSKVDFKKLVNDLKTTISDSTDEQIIFKIMRLFGSLGSGHNVIIPTSVEKGALKQLPVQFYYFNDGMYIVDAQENYEKWIGHKVEFIGDKTIDEALKLTDVINARDNNMQSLWLGPYYLSLPTVLEGLNIIEDSKEVKLTLKSSDGKKEIIPFKGKSWNFYGFPKLPKLRTRNQPLFLSQTEDNYWSKSLTVHNAIYVQFNLVQQKKEMSLLDFNLKLRKDIKQSNFQNLILDLRFNSGGNGSITPPMLKTLIEFEVINPKGKIFVLMGRGTFSAAQNLLTEITKFTNAILVGEPSGSKPSFIGESGWFKLPNSGLMGLVASQFHQTSKAEDFRQWIAPHIPVGLSSTDYFSGDDKALRVVLEMIKSSRGQGR